MMNQYCDRLPPQNTEAEEALLSACLHGYNPDEIFDILKPDDFYRRTYQILFRHISNLKNKKQPIDLVTVTDSLRNAGEAEKVGGVTSIVMIMETPLTANQEYCARIIKTASTARKLIQAAYKIAEDSHSISIDNISEVLDSVQQKILSIEAPNQQCEAVHIRDIINESINHCEQASTMNGVTGLTTGLKDLDYILGGLQPSDLIILAARPAMGKTALCMNIAERCGVPVLVFSLEMDKEKLSFRMLAGKSNINLTRLTTGRLIPEDWEGLTNAAMKLSDLPIYVDDSPSLHYSEIRRRSRLMSKKVGIKLIVVDYLQLMRGDNGQKGNREAEISSISRALKAIAKELSIPVVALSQLNRELEKRSNKRPELSDLRESGQIEQDADVVMFIYRDEIYNRDEHNPKKGQAEIIISKHRNGPTGTAIVQFIPTTTTFKNLITEKPYASNREDYHK